MLQRADDGPDVDIGYAKLKKSEMFTVGGTAAVVVVVVPLVVVVAGVPLVTLTAPISCLAERYRVTYARSKKVNPELQHRAAVYFRKLYFQQYFLGTDWSEGQDVHHGRRISLGDQSRTLCDIFGSYMAGKNDRGTRWADVICLVGKMRFSSFAAVVTSTSTRRSKLRDRSSSSQMSNETSPAARP